jgi:hypothetical protein
MGRINSNNTDYVAAPGERAISYRQPKSPGEVGHLETQLTSTADPKVKAPNKFDFHLTGGSPLIGAGSTVSAVTDDFDGKVNDEGKLIPGDKRPQGDGYDIGADEYCTPGTSGCKQP